MEELSEMIDRLKSDMEELISDKDNEIDGLEARIEELEQGPASVEEAAEQLLQHYTGHEPSAGDVDALKADITGLLVNKYHVSIGAI